MSVFHNFLLRLNSSSPVMNIRSQIVNRLSTSSALNYTKMSLEEKLGIKPKPKKPSTPFLKYMSLNRASITQSNPKASPSEVVKILSEHWKNEKDSLKEKLHQEYLQEKEKYIEDLKEYDKLLSPLDKEELAKAKENLITEKEKRAVRKKKKELGCPKKPASSFVLFIKSRLSERGDTPYIEFQKLMKKEWDALPETEKSKFEKHYQEDLEAYKKNLNLWSAQMKEKGLDISDILKVKVKKPGTAYSHYMKVRFMERGDTPVAEFSRQVSREWEQLPVEEKNKFEEMKKKDIEEYEMKLRKSRQSKSKPGEKSDIVPLLRSETSAEPSPSENNEKKDTEEGPPNIQTSSTAQESKTFKFTTREIILKSVLISATFVVVFSIYIIVFY